MKKCKQKTMSFVFHADPGHAWLGVRRELLLQFGKAAQAISSCSYQRGLKVYLETDKDAHSFLNALRDDNITFKVVTKQSQRSSPIRSYAPFLLTNAERLALCRYPVGTRVVSIFGDMADTELCCDVSTGKNAVGTIAIVLPEQEHCYGVDFPNGVSIFLSPNELADTLRYKVYKPYDVHLFPIVRIKISGIPANNQVDAIQKAENMLDLHAKLEGGEFEFTEGIDCYLIDEVGDAEYRHSRWYQNDGVTPLAQKKRMPLYSYRAILYKVPGDASSSFVFDCQAEDIGHANEQANNAYPDTETVTITKLR